MRFRINGNIFDLKKLKAVSKTQKIITTELLFADDAAICSYSEEELQLMILVFYETFKEFGLELAIEKTEVMMQKAHPKEERPNPKIMVNGNTLKVVNKFKYLGSQLQDNASNSAEIDWRIKLSAAAFSKLHQRIWKKRLKTNIRTYKTMIVPCMIYSSESWNCTKKEIRKLEGLQYRQLRSILGKTWKDRISHVQLLQSIKFGPNFNFNWAVSDEDKTKDPKLS